VAKHGSAYKAYVVKGKKRPKKPIPITKTKK